MSEAFFHEDMQWFLRNRVDWSDLLRIQGRSAVSVDDELATYTATLETADAICRDLEKECRLHWHEEAQLVDDEVKVPPFIAAGYERLRQAGLVCLPISPDFGGYGLPFLINTFYLEMLARANSSLMTIVGLQTGVAGDIERYGSEDIKQRYLPKLTSGEWQGSMDLTEPNAGSDLGGIVTRVTEEQGRFFLDGEKIFITNGGSQVHLVLAREAGMFQETRGTTNGLSLVLVPAFLPDGSRNRMRVTRVERKMGLHGSPTCAVEFDHAEGFILGTRGRGFRAMLDLMNSARLGVAAQALGLGQAAFEEALNYAKQRVQFDAPIIQQPLVKSMLTQMTINLQAARALLYRTSALVDRLESLRRALASAGSSPPAEWRQEFELLTQTVRLLTPLCKYYATEISNDVARKAIQIHGGLGYMAESHVAHLHCDSIITTIYEGTSEIQASFALKEMSKGSLFTVLDQIVAEVQELKSAYPEDCQRIEELTNKWIQGSLPSLLEDPRYALLNAKRLVEMVIDIIAAVELLHQAKRSEGKRLAARSFLDRRALAIEMGARRIQSGDVKRLTRYDKILGIDAEAAPTP
ncbi:MAG: acyl-CoA dehydrogenase family protein [Candidatus Binatia bacterium]|nr:acyl-CoA dehydrogenase family protein [Candidatus Binatia bacterium]